MSGDGVRHAGSPFPLKEGGGPWMQLCGQVEPTLGRMLEFWWILLWHPCPLPRILSLLLLGSDGHHGSHWQVLCALAVFISLLVIRTSSRAVVSPTA